MKACPTCGREIAVTAGACDTCEAWAAALAETRPDEGLPRPLETAKAPAAPVEATKAPAASRRQLTYVAAGVAVVALTGFAISVRGGSAPEAGGTAAVSASTATARPPVAAVPAPAATSAVQTWSTENRATWLGNSRRGAAFELASENVVKTWFGPARPALVVRCSSQAIEAFVLTRSPMRLEPRVEGKTVTISVDGEPVRTELWNDSDDRTAVFAPDAAAFVQRLRSARTVNFGFTPHNSSNVVAQFSVAGLDELITAAKKDCAASPKR